MAQPVYQSDLTPWASRDVGAEALALPLPRGYRIRGLSNRGVTLLRLFRDRWEQLVEQRVPSASAPDAYRGLVDVAWMDARELGDGLCGVCHRRPAESTADIGGVLMDVCGTCTERAHDERGT